MRPSGRRDPAFAAATRPSEPAPPAPAPAPRLAIVRTAWLFGLPGSGLPAEDPGRRRRSRRPTVGTASLVADEIGCPTYAPTSPPRSSTSSRRRGVRAGGTRRHPPRRQRRARLACRVGPRGAATRRDRRPHADVPLEHVAAAVDAAALGSAGAHATPRRSAALVADGAAGVLETATPQRRRANERGRDAVGTARRHVREAGAASPTGADRSWRSGGPPSFGDLTQEMAGLPDARFVQANLSTSAQGVLRGLHYHRRQLDYWIVVGGRALVALVDVRPVSADIRPLTPSWNSANSASARRSRSRPASLTASSPSSRSSCCTW